MLSVASLSLGLLATSSPAGAAVASTRVTNVRVAARPALPTSATTLGPTRATAPIAGDVALKPRNAALLASYAASVAKPGSLFYGHYLSPASIEAEFAPSISTVRAVEHSLRAGGLEVTKVSTNRLLVGFSGTVDAVRAAFHTGIENYRLASGRRVFANTSAVEMPASIAGSVRAVVGLNDLVVPIGIPIKRSTKIAASAPRTRAPRVNPPAGAAAPCAAASAIATRASSLTANQVAYAYGLDPLYASGDFGAGQTIDILDLFGFSPTDIATFDKCYYGTAAGSAIVAKDTFTNIDGGAEPGNGGGGSVETELDVEAANAYAPKAAVDVYEAPDTNSGFLDDIASMTASSAKVESISYGECEAEAVALEPGYLETENYLFEEAAAMGKTVFASSADNGSDTCSSDSGEPVSPILSDSDPASQPYVTAVGGTAITAATDPPQEEVWNDGTAGGSGGGGISAIWPEPAWQAASKVPGINNSAIVSGAEAVNGDNFCLDYYSGVDCREVPDVSAQGSPNTGGFPVFIQGGWNVYGGTSLASPTWGAILADVNSTPSCSAEGGAGFISPKLYAIASVPSEYAASFNDVKIGNNDNFGAAAGLYPATPGYDMATGLGSPRVTGPGGTKGLAYYLCAAPATAAPTVTGVSPAALSSSAVAGGAQALTITGTNFEVGGTSDVAAVSIGNVAVPYSVASATSSSVTVPSQLFAAETGNGGAFDGSGTYDVTVTLVGGATSAPGAQSTIVLYNSGPGATGATPVVDGVSPAAGLSAGGNAVTIYGSGFTNAKSVTFGGSPATSFSVVNDSTITAVTPPEPPNALCVSGDDETTGVCQSQVQVALTDGTTSAEATIAPEFSGALATATSVAGLYPAATEFDYEPPPTISAITLAGGASVASEAGDTEATITGTGLGYLGFGWIDVGSYLNDSAIDGALLSVSSTSVTFLLNAIPATSSEASVPIWVQTYGSQNNVAGLATAAPSNSVAVTYAPTPVVKSLHVPGTKYLAGSTSGGTTLTIDGSGFDDSFVVSLIDLKYGFPTTQYVFDSASDTAITITTPAAITGVYAVEVCGASGCSALSSQSYTYYLPGNPALTASTPRSGTAGTTVTISGYNLGFVQAVYFGTKRSTSFSQPAFFESGNTYEVQAKAPAGVAGSRVDIRVVTIESLATGYGTSHVNPSVSFSYAKKRR